MKACRFTDVQKAFFVKQGDGGVPVAEICRKAGISQAMYFNRKKNYSGLMPSEIKKLCELEDENKRFKKIVTDQRGSRNFGPVVKVDRMMRKTIQDEETKEPFS